MKSILQEAQNIVEGARRKSYGPADKSFRKIAAGWTQILGVEVSSAQVAMCMIWQKMMRESNKASRDNRVDMAGYTQLLDMIQEAEEALPPAGK